MKKTLKRCEWADSGELYKKYHDEEWGKPVHDDDIMFEFLLLEGFQAGLSWITILKKRENFREAFDHFDYKKIACYPQEKLDSLLQNEGIIRNRLKIRSAVLNAQKFIEVQKEFGSFCDYLWKFVDGKPVINKWKNIRDVPASTGLSDRISKDLKKRGFKFVGTTIIYAYLQAVGIVNDHTTDCFCYPAIQK
jgi:DNA-3-methyladenine glycosylase I